MWKLLFEFGGQTCLNLWVIEIEFDAKLVVVVVVDLLKKDGDISNGNDNIVTDFKEGLKKIPMVRILYC